MKNTSLVILLVVILIGLYLTFFTESEFIFSQKETTGISQNIDREVPGFLTRSFPDTDWSKVDPSIYGALGGGPAKDGIPAIDEPKFETLASVSYQDGALAVVAKDGELVKVYPYNILVWHEIVNDTVGGVPMAITFCPLCGSAIVYNRTLPDGITTFGVSGSLIESNMVMYDRATESLWQQSTGRALAGRYLGTELALEKFQLLTMGEVKSKYEGALVLSQDTGYSRDYERAPYGGYNESDEFIFAPSVNDTRYPPKKIFVVFKVAEATVAVPWLELVGGKTYETSVVDTKVSIVKSGGELEIKDSSGTEVPFYFEMWFSFAVQNPDTGIVFDPSKN
jgi:hypothetical protein